MVCHVAMIDVGIDETYPLSFVIPIDETDPIQFRLHPDLLIYLATQQPSVSSTGRLTYDCPKRVAYAAEFLASCVFREVGGEKSSHLPPFRWCGSVGGLVVGGRCG